MSDYVEKHTHGDLVLYIERDEDPSDPEENDCPVYLVHVHRDLYRIPKEGLPFTDEEGLKKFFRLKVQGMHSDWLVLPLASYIHGGVVLALVDSPEAARFPDRQWDVSHCGWIFIRKDGEWGADVDFPKMAEEHVSMWNKYLSGEVYGYRIVRKKECPTCGHAEHEELESCWGFYELEFCRDEGLSVLGVDT